MVSLSSFEFCRMDKIKRLLNNIVIVNVKPMKEQSHISDNIVQIENILRKYLDLLYNGDTNLIETVFLPAATVNSLTDGKIVSVLVFQDHAFHFGHSC